MPLKDKVYAALSAFALGDAMGMPTELISPDEIKAWYGYVDTLVEPHPQHYHAVDMHRGMITDDTELTLEVIDALIRNGGVSVEAAVDTMLTWAGKCDVMNKTYLGPSSRRALEAIANGLDPAIAGRNGTTDGGPMRILPIGILNAGDPEMAARDACTFCVPTHGSNIAMAGAATIAAAAAEALVLDVASSGPASPAATEALTLDAPSTPAESPTAEALTLDAPVAPLSLPAALARILEAAKKGASIGEARGFYIRENRLLPLLDELLTLSESEPDDALFYPQVYARYENSMETDLIVPAILALFVRCQGDPMRIVVAAANLGGDTDTIGAIAGGLGGALMGPSSLDAKMIREVETINHIDLRQKAEDFLAFCEAKKRE